jgi:hypothetical protein
MKNFRKFQNIRTRTGDGTADLKRYARGNQRKDALNRQFALAPGQKADNGASPVRRRVVYV